jgi:L-iditol 2-dehydrogenase
MKAVYLRGVEDIAVIDAPEPIIPVHGMLVRVETCAVCGTDVKMYRNGYTAAKLPLIPGHELAGRIEMINGDFHGFSVGMRVAVAPNIPCGVCSYCRDGLQTACDSLVTIGVQRDGGFAELMALPSSAVEAGCVFPIPDGVPSESAALIDPASCAVNACEISRVKPGDTVAVLGAGPAGCLCLEVSRAFGATTTMLIQRSPDRLAGARFTNADIFIDSSREDPLTRVREVTNGRGAEVVIVACGVAEAQEQAMQMVAKRGSVNLFGGLPKSSPNIHLDSNLVHYKEFSVSGTHGGSNRHCDIALHMIADGRIKAREYVSRRFALSEFAAALAAAEGKAGLKVFVSP